jgi:hypothetical protein
MNQLSCMIVSVAHGNALCIAKELGAVSKPVLGHFIVDSLAMNFLECGQSGDEFP